MQVDFEDQLKSSVGIKTDIEMNKKVITSLKSEVKQNTTDVEQCKNMLSNLKTSQEATQSKMGNLDEKLTELRQLTEGMELEVIRQKKNHNKLSQSMSSHVFEVEHDLAHHIETVKCNMEEEVSVAKQNQKLIENKLANFTEEIAHQNSNLNMKIHDLQKDFDQLKTITGKVNASSENSHSFLSDSNSDVYSGSNISFDSQNSTATNNAGIDVRFNSFDSQPPQIENQIEYLNKTGACSMNTH